MRNSSAEPGTTLLGPTTSVEPSSTIKLSGTYAFTFTTAGTCSCDCAVHGLSMTATVVVKQIHEDPGTHRSSDLLATPPGARYM